ncbi:MAG TPA: PKD domain-containing protein [Solirubrobacteraceae bacterium]|nr:PKD domain-containing protein [Solirubrobacteraceae bacterium]
MLWLLQAAPAGAKVVTVPTGSGSEEVNVGLLPRESEFALDGATVGSFNNPEGNPVLHKNETYAIYWDPTDHYHGDWQHLIDTFFQGLGDESGTTGTVFAVDSQYTDRSNQPASYRSIFRGAYTDTDPYPVTSNCTDPHPLEVLDRIGPENAKKEHTPVCLTDAQLRKELQTFIADHDLQKGMSSIFYLLTPPGVTVCLDEGAALGAVGHCSDYTGSTESYENSFCSYHSAFSDATLKDTTTPEANTVLYGVIPWTAGGQGDYHLLPSDQTSAYDCQDGGWYRNPANSTFEQEKAKEAKIESKKEEEEHPKNAEEKQIKAREEAKRKALEGPHEEEPNQPPEKKVGPDGSPDTGLADLIISQIGVQQQSIVTDPLLDAWHDEAGYEVAEECRNFFLEYLGGSASASEFTFAGTLYNQLYNGFKSYITDAFDLAAERLPYPGVPCMTGIDLVPQFTAPNTVNTGELVGFNGMESNITLGDDIAYSKSGTEESKYATYKWNFGDGTPEITGVAPGAPSLNSPETSPCELPWQAPCAASTFHSYQYGGKYNVTLTVTDTGGNTATVTEPITVVGPSPPPPPGAGGGSGAAGANSTPGGSSGGSGKSSSTPSVPGPIATAAAVSNSLKQVAKGGLVVRYSVNEQVAGRFEVLLEAATAHRLRISGPAATNLPAGSPASLVIGHALLVTTKGGKSSVRIKFSKSVAKRLRHAKRVKLTLRLTARNANAQNPLFTTVMSTVELHR